MTTSINADLSTDIPRATGRPTRSAPRRRARRIAIGLTIVVLTAAIGSRALLARRPTRQVGELHGVDVSNHQGHIDWQRVANDGIDFAYIKATEGGDWIDDRFAENWEHAGDEGLLRGAYHFFTLCRPGADQADNFLATVPDHDDDALLPPGVDLELAGNCDARPDPATVRRELTTFLDRVEASTGQPAILYLSDDFDEAFAISVHLTRRRWIADVLKRPSPPWYVWQTTWAAHVDGIDGGVDHDVLAAPA